MNAKSITASSIKNIWLYWENKEGHEMPSYIGLCHKTIYKANKDAQIHLVTPENLTDYLPGFNKDLQIIIKNTNEPSLALKTDYIRVLLLEKYGGLWLDSDIIVCKDLVDPVINILEVKEFICIQKENGNVSNNFMASIPQGRVISEYKKKIEEELNQHDTFQWTQIGNSLLTPVVEKFKDTVHFIDELRIHPVSFKESGIFFKNSLIKGISDVIKADTLIVMLYNSLFDGSLKKYAAFRYWSEEEILNKDMLISAIFRNVLKEGYTLSDIDNEIQDDYYLDIGLIIPTIDRFESLNEFLKSIYKFFPRIAIYIAVQGDHDKEKYEKLDSKPNVHLYFVPYDYGLSASRNFLVKKVKEQYVFLCDDDFIFTKRTNLKAAYQILTSNAGIKIVGGMLLNYYYDENNVFQRKQYTSFCNILLKSNAKINTAPVFIPVEYLNIKKHFIDPTTYYLYCDTVNNFALIDKSIFFEYDLWWDDQFKIMGEHEDFYLRVNELNKFKTVYSNALVAEHHLKTNLQFHKLRSRSEGQINLLKKWGYSNLVIVGKRIDRIFREEYLRIPFRPSNKLKNRNEQINELKNRNEQINELKIEIQKIYTSKSWQFSKPFRSILKFIKH